MSNVADQKRRAFWLKHLHQWHWVSTATCRSQIRAKPTVTTREAKLPAPVLARLETNLGPDEGFDYAAQRNIAALFISKSGDTLVEKMTPRFATYLN
jgi:hypothetical protein